jgi:aspartyl-tRNA(Asn)/glutamyl-tRNA(Gln) amidotransferase subunit B
MENKVLQNKYEAVIGLEIHAELATHSKMFCNCPVVDTTQVEANIAVCPVCAGMPGVLPVVNRRAVEYGLRVALALQCEIPETSIFARKNYFYPDLPKGYQISQYEQPLAYNGRLILLLPGGERMIHIRRVHLEEDTGKLTHVNQNGESYSLIDLNRAGVPLLEIVSEPDLHSAEEVRNYAYTLRSILRYLSVNTGDMQKGILRIEPNVSVRLSGSQELGTRTEIKNLNSFRALERSVDYEIKRQCELLDIGKTVIQETLGWDDIHEVTVSQRSKEEAHDYRYFPEPDLPPLVVAQDWIDGIRLSLPELPVTRFKRLQSQYGLNEYDAEVLTAEREVADYFEQTLSARPLLPPKSVANWISGELFGLMNQSEPGFKPDRIPPQAFAQLLEMVNSGEISQSSGKAVLSDMFLTGKDARTLVQEDGLSQISDHALIASLVDQALEENAEQVAAYLKGKEGLSRWLFGQVMRLAKNRANPQLVQAELNRQLKLRQNK